MVVTFGNRSKPAQPELQGETVSKHAFATRAFAPIKLAYPEERTVVSPKRFRIRDLAAAMLSFFLFAAAIACNMSECATFTSAACGLDECWVLTS